MSLLKKNILKYGISFTVALWLAYAFINLRVDLQNPAATPLLEWYRIVCDAFTIPGLTFLGLGCLVSLSNQGALDGLGYAATVAFKMLIGAGARQERYKEYLDRRRANRLRGYGFLYVVGGVCTIVAVVFLILFNMNYGR